jgi:hypothetical protein
MKTLKKLFGFFILIAICYFIYLIGNYFINIFKELDPKISTSIIAGMFTVFAGLSVVIITQRQTKLREIAEAHRQKKIDIYNDFIDLASSLLASQNELMEVSPIEEKDLVKKLFKFKKEILLWGSPKVIKAELKLNESYIKDSDFILFYINDLYKSMREDIGLSNHNLNNNELIKLFINDPDEVDKMYKKFKS